MGLLFKSYFKKLYDVLNNFDHDDVEGLDAIEKEIQQSESKSSGQTAKELAWKLRLANSVIEKFNLEKGDIITEGDRIVNIGKTSLVVNIEL